MSHVDKNQPEGTPTWIDLGIPDLDQAMDFYRRPVRLGVRGRTGGGRALHDLPAGRPGVAALAPNPDPDADAFCWNVYFAADDCDRTSERVLAAGGELVQPPMDVMEQGRMAIARDPVGAQFGLWQGRNRIGCETVNEPGALVRNDLITANPGPARAFYAAVFDFSLDGNPDLPDFDFTFLRRPDGHEIGGIMGVPDAASSAWATTFEVADTDWALAAGRRPRRDRPGRPRTSSTDGWPPSPIRSAPSSRSSPGRPERRVDVVLTRRRQTSLVWAESGPTESSEESEMAVSTFAGGIDRGTADLCADRRHDRRGLEPGEADPLRRCWHRDRLRGGRRGRPGLGGPPRRRRCIGGGQRRRSLRRAFRPRTIGLQGDRADQHPRGHRRPGQRIGPDHRDPAGRLVRVPLDGSGRRSCSPPA